LQVRAGLAGAPRQIRRQSVPMRKTLAVASLVVAALFFATAFVTFLTDAVFHPGVLLNWYDLDVYNDAGLLARQLPSDLYSWQLVVSIKFTYTPFAALLFACGSYLDWTALRWIMTLASVVAIPLTVWLTLGAMGKRGVGRATLTLTIGAVALWLEPVTKSFKLGQIEPLLLLLIVWDLTRKDGWRFKGAGVGIAAGIKLVPLLFIPYLLLAGKARQAVVATVTFAVTVIVGFIVLPGPSVSYWLTGYFINPGRTGAIDALVNQSLLGMIARHMGSGPAAEPVWLPVAIVVALGGVGAAALLSRAGAPVAGWVLVGITSVLVSPISWDHHWVWVVPLLTLIAVGITSARGLARGAYIAAGVAVALVFGSWPYDGPQGLVLKNGLVGWFVQPPQSLAVKGIHGWELLTWNLFVVAGLIIYLVMLVAAPLIWRRNRFKPGPPAPPPATAAHTPIDALLARADALLKPGAPDAPSGASSASSVARS
jgi:alpha-1,2-mannosyltransferase